MPCGDLREFLFSSKEHREGAMRVYVLWISFFLFVVLVSPISAQLTGGGKEWNEILSAAKKEGRVVEFRDTFPCTATDRSCGEALPDNEYIASSGEAHPPCDRERERDRVLSSQTARAGRCSSRARCSVACCEGQ